VATPGVLIVETQGATDRTPLAAAPRRGVLRALLRRPAAALSLGCILVLVLMAVFAPVLSSLGGWSPYAFDPKAIDADLGGVPLGPLGGAGARHWFGVEPQSGRDIFARIVTGARVSITIAVLATALTTAIGVLMGMVAGYLGGVADQVISRLMDFLMAFPALIFMIALLSALPAGQRQYLLVVVLTFFGWPYTARIVRGQTLALKARDFVEAARSSGASDGAVVLREILPNLRGTILVLSTMSVPGFIGTEAGLSFLGIGVVPPTPSWGQMIAASVSWYTVDPWYFVIPGLFLFVTVLSFTVLGDHLKSVLDPGGNPS